MKFHSKEMKKGGRCWFAVDSKSFDLSIEEVDGRLKGTIMERGRVFFCLG